MDPFLEQPASGPDVHHRLLTRIGDQLAAAVSPDFVVRIEQRVYVTHTEHDAGYPQLIPDVIVTHRPPAPELALAGGPPGPAVATITAPMIIEAVTDLEVRDAYIEIHDAESDAVVTAIELLSPANKVKRSRGHKAMIEKRKLLLRGGAHWLEIDLLRDGERDEGVAGRSDYCVTLRRRGFGALLAWFIDLRDRLPTVAVPLREPHADAPLDLQAALDDTYAQARYADSVNYTRPLPPPALPPADAAWAERLVAAWRAERGEAGGGESA